MGSTGFLNTKEEVRAATPVDRLRAVRLQESPEMAELLGVVWESAKNQAFKPCQNLSLFIGV